MYACKTRTFYPLVRIDVYFCTFDAYTPGSTAKAVRLSRVRTCDPENRLSRLTEAKEGSPSTLPMASLSSSKSVRHTEGFAGFPRREAQTWDSKILGDGVFDVKDRFGGVMSTPGEGESMNTDDW
jgi:hypothetical protein